MTATGTLDRPPLPPGPPPASIGAACPKCSGTRFTTSLQTFKDRTKHLRVSCAGCGRFVGYAPQSATPEAPAFEYQPRPADAHHAELKPPPASWRWVGYVRPGDGVWYPVADCATLHGCWEAILSSHMVGDRLCVPVRPHHRKDGAESEGTGGRE